MKAVLKDVAETLENLWTGLEEGLELKASGGLEGKYLGEIWKGQQMTQVKKVRQKHTPHYCIHS